MQYVGLYVDVCMPRYLRLSACLPSVCANCAFVSLWEWHTSLITSLTLLQKCIEIDDSREVNFVRSESYEK